TCFIISHLVHFFQNGQDSLEGQDEKFHGRTSLFLDQMKHGNLSLKISNCLGDYPVLYFVFARLAKCAEQRKSNKLGVLVLPH
uniref:Uncharacterized protein n=1 Tax=Serinus canaria TaxID=9135 RepID=A0A8C9NAK3_SERCA